MFSYICLQALDVVTTVHGLGLGAVETNPLALSLMNMGVWVPLKVVAGLFVPLGLYAAAKLNPRYGVGLAWSFNAFMGLVVLNNFVVIAQ